MTRSTVRFCLAAPLEKLIIHKSTEEDWIKLQGGKPRLFARVGIVDVIHDYNGGSKRIIPTPLDRLEETVRIGIGERIVEFPVALIDDLHGGPCEVRSKRVGGKGYRRISSKLDRKARE